MRNNKLWKVFSFIIAATFIVICIYLMIGSGSSMSILKSYDAVKPDSTSGFSKQLQFVESYTRVTQDTTLAQRLGISEEDAEAMAQGSTTQGGNGIGDYSNFGTLSLSDQVSKLQKQDGGFNYTYYQKYLKSYNYNNHEFVWESQSGEAWNSFKPSSASMRGAGCFFYATAALVGAENGKVYTIENLLTDLGGTVSYDASGVFIVTNSPISDLDGSIDLLNKILSKSGCGKTAKVVSSIDESKLANGAMYLIYATKKAGSSTNLYSVNGAGSHWTAVVGITKEGKYIVLGNGDRSVELDSSSFNSLAHIFEVN